MDQWEQLRQQCMSCRACGLADTRTNVVFGVGDPRAEVLLVGEPREPARTGRASLLWGPPGSCWTICWP